jgi:uncharacterized membrane protein YiaA
MNFPILRYVLDLFMPMAFLIAALPNLLFGILIVISVIVNLFMTKQFKAFRHYFLVLIVAALFPIYHYCQSVAEQMNGLHFEGLPTSSQLTPAASFHLQFGMYVAVSLVYYFMYFFTKKSNAPQSNPPK